MLVNALEYFSGRSRNRLRTIGKFKFMTSEQRRGIVKRKPIQPDHGKSKARKKEERGQERFKTNGSSCKSDGASNTDGQN